MTAPTTAPLLTGPLFERVPTAQLPLPSRGGRHRAPTRGRRRLGRALVVLALARGPRRPTSTRT